LRKFWKLVRVPGVGGGVLLREEDQEYHQELRQVEELVLVFLDEGVLPLHQVVFGVTLDIRSELMFDLGKAEESQSMGEGVVCLGHLFEQLGTRDPVQGQTEVLPQELSLERESSEDLQLGQFGWSRANVEETLQLREDLKELTVENENDAFVTVQNEVRETRVEEELDGLEEGDRGQVGVVEESEDLEQTTLHLLEVLGEGDELTCVSSVDALEIGRGDVVVLTRVFAHSRGIQERRLLTDTVPYTGAFLVSGQLDEGLPHSR
jgi:hypothetical protein